MSSYRKLELKRFAPVAEFESADARYWNKYRDPVVADLGSKINSISFCPTQPHNFVVSASSRLAIFDGFSCEIKKTLSRFRAEAYSAHYRMDGKLIAAGSEDPIIQIFEPSTRLPVRTLHGHTNSVHVTRWSRDNNRVISCSDDKTMRGWDLSVQKQIHCFEGHSDYVRCGFESELNSNVWISGSYDGSVRMWDCRAPETQQCVLKLDHGSPIQDALMLPIGSILVSAGESSIKLWDLHGGGRLIHEFSHHQKLVSALCFDSQQSRLLSASLDRMVKCYDVTDFQVVHSMKFPEPILCMQLSPDFSKLVVGQSTGQLIIRRRELPQENGLIESSAKKLRGGTYKYFVRGQDELPSQDDFKIEHVRKQQLRPYDAFLKKFQYHDALNAALESRNPIVVISLLDELIQRDCLGTALSGRDEVSLEPLLHFIIKQITNPHFNMLLNRVSHAVLDIYSTSVGHSVLVHQMLVSLQTKLRDEIRLQKDMFRLLGSLELLLAASQLKGGAEIK